MIDPRTQTFLKVFDEPVGLVVAGSPEEKLDQLLRSYKELRKLTGDLIKTVHANAELFKRDPWVDHHVREISKGMVTKMEDLLERFDNLLFQDDLRGTR